MPKLIRRLDENLIFILTGFLLSFIPLYPKLPLFEAIPGYIVRVRLEDLLIAGTILIWLFYLWRGKIKFGPNPLSKPIAIYLFVGFLSMISAMFIINTLPLNQLHIGKMFLHFLRRIEYFSLFFIFFSTVKNLRQVKIYTAIICLTVFLVTIYGYGQKYLYWPAFSTMNREFSKGWWLYLTEHARVLSTFGGHYDLAAYLVMVLTLFWSLFFGIRNKIFKWLVFIILTGAFFLLMLTASRTSFIAYLAAVIAMFILWQKIKGWGWVIPRVTAVLVLSLAVMLFFGDLSDRFSYLFKNNKLKEYLSFIPFNSTLSSNQMIYLGGDNDLSQVSPRSDEPPSIIKPETGNKERPADVYEDIPEPLPINFAASESGQIATLSGVENTQEKMATGASRKRVYSKNAVTFDLSTGIRLDTLWPQAIQGFLRNPFLGSGYSTLTKTTKDQFTEAESTDNDYLRALGETGILGFLSFFAIIFIILKIIFKEGSKIKDSLVYSITAGLGGAVVGLLVNAFYIDVFEASKVAFIFWALMGILIKTIQLSVAKAKKT